jgi:phenylalanyl-tRNA synthetase beta chain
MKLVHSWLADLLPGLGDDHEAIADEMTRLGLQVEGIGRVGASVPGVVTARVLRTAAHPDAAKVHRVFVDTGDGVERHVWCGAFNMSAGDVVPLALPGTAMPDGRTIAPKPILGIPSDGMLCSARELGLGDDHTGILLLAADTALGVPYGDVLGLVEEVVYDIDVTRNRPDAWGHRGVARDIAPGLGLTLGGEPVALLPVGGRSASVDVVDGERCTVFLAAVISGVRVGPSAEWMARRLRAAGMRPINNVVDVSNYVMLERSQPNHAYDLDTLGGQGFRVRRAVAGEQLVTLDDVTRSLSSADLLICDAADVPIGLAGVMGGRDSEISDSTTTIALEIARFDAVATMQMAQRHGLRTEASARFERGVDPAGAPPSAARFVELLAETCPALVVETITVGGAPPPPTEVVVRPAKVNAVLGTTLQRAEMAALLTPIGFITADAGDDLRVTIPSWRPDSTDEIDVVEEIARHYGYERIGKTVPCSTMHGRLSPAQRRRRQVREVLLGSGISEAMPNPFLADDDLRRAGLDGSVLHIVNPLAAEERVLRTSLRPGLLKTIALNESHRRPGVALFEIGHVYPPGDGVLPDEHEELGVVLAGREAPAAMAVWRELASAMGWGARVDQSSPPAGLHPGRSAVLSIGRGRIGALGEVHPDVLEAFGIDERVAVLELDLTVLLASEPRPAQWRPTSRFPSSDIDLAFLTPETVPAEKVDKAIRQSAGALLVDLALFDVYRGAGVGEGARSLAYRLRLQAPDRTLTDGEVADLREKVIAAVAKLGATLR